MYSSIPGPVDEFGLLYHGRVSGTPKDTVEIGYSTRAGLSPYVRTDIERGVGRIF